jgi:hypothetical protein
MSLVDLDRPQLDRLKISVRARRFDAQAFELGDDVLLSVVFTRAAGVATLVLVI